MKRPMLVASGFLLGAAMLVADPAAQAQRLVTDGRSPKLFVVLMVDQMRGDYVEKFHHQWSRGLRRLISDGAWFRHADYPYFNTVTCSGHASVSTGALPAIHGMILNSWWERESRKQVACTRDETVTIISYGKAVTAAGESATRLRSTTLADELRAQLATASRIAAFSLKARSAIPLGGQRPDAVAWFDDDGAWVTSTAFSKGPVPAVADFVAHHPVENDFGRIWDRALPKTAYLYDDPPVGLRPAKNQMTPSFPHIVKGPEAQPGSVFYDQWQSSPFADEYLARMGSTVADALHFGKSAGPNLLAIGFSSLDKVGHDYGPHSHEIQDVLVRLDRTLGDLFAALDRLVGPGNYTVALTADHGVAPVPERMRAMGIDAGRLSAAAIVSRAEQSLARSLGPGQHVQKFVHNYLYFEPGVYDELRSRPGAWRTVAEDLRAVPGVLKAYSRDELAADHVDTDPMRRKASVSYDPGRSGDVMVVFKPYWMESTGTTSHGTGYAYDTRVPVMLMGKGIVAGEYLQPASPLDIAPTLAFLAGITLPQASGRVLAEALSPAKVSPASQASSVDHSSRP